MKAPNVVSAGTTAAAISFKADWAYKQQSWPHASGNGDAEGSAQNTTIAVGLTIDAVSGKVKFATTQVTIKIGDSKIEIHGGVIAWVISLLEGLFRKSIQSAIENAVQKAITDGINVKLNESIQKASFTPEVKIPKTNPKLDWIVDLSLPVGGIVVTEQYISIASSLTSYPLNKKDPPPFKPVDLPTTPISTQDDANVFISDYIANSAFYTLHTTGQLQYAILPSDVPADSPIKLNTTAFKSWLPELYAKYPDKNIRIDATTSASPTLASTPEGTNVIANTTLLFSIFTTETTLEKVFSVELDVYGRYLNASVSSAKEGTLLNLFGKVEVTTNMRLLESYMGPVNVTNFGKIIQLIVINGQVNALNKKLAVGLPIDLHKSAPGLIIDNAKVGVNTGYVAVSAHISYIPQIVYDNVSAVMDMLAQMLNKIKSLENKVASLENKISHCKQANPIKLN
jgi:lipopolysaccharide-binding protein